MLDKGDLITLSDNKEYVVANTTTLDNLNYVYLITKDGFSDFKLCQIDEERQELLEVSNLNIIEKLLTIFSKR